MEGGLPIPWMAARLLILQPLDRRSLALATISTVVEWYDFTLFLYLTTVLSRLFFVGENGQLYMRSGPYLEGDGRFMFGSE